MWLITPCIAFTLLLHVFRIHSHTNDVQRIKICFLCIFTLDRVVHYGKVNIHVQLLLELYGTLDKLLLLHRYTRSRKDSLPCFFCLYNHPTRKKDLVCVVSTCVIFQV